MWKKNRKKERQVTSDPSASSAGLRAAVGLTAERSLLAPIADSVSVVDSTDEDSLAIAQGIDQREAYLCPWDEEILDLLKAVLADSTLAELVLMASEGLPLELEINRNVNPKPSAERDLYADEIRRLPSKLPDESKESVEEKNLQAAVWKHDLLKCNEANEALFQRTLMMAMIDRHRFFFDKKTATPNRYDFSVEKLWKTWPMPTRAFGQREKVPARPKPDLCVSFRREQLLERSLMAHIPIVTWRLIHFEGMNAGGEHRIFPFLTIEAKKSFTAPDDRTALYQSLNNASQALHILYEFFHEAGSDEIFFEKVRFFSAAAMSTGIKIRIHRAVFIDQKPSEAGYQRIVSDYPLAFEYEDFESAVVVADGSGYERQKVVNTFENIIWGYGSVLFNMLRETARKVAEKFESQPDLAYSRSEKDYRHGQIWGFSRNNSVMNSQADGDSFHENAQQSKRRRTSNY